MFQSAKIAMLILRILCIMTSCSCGLRRSGVVRFIPVWECEESISDLGHVDLVI